MSVQIQASPIQPETHTPNTDRSLAETIIRVGSNGTLTNLSIEIITGTIEGDLYIRLSRLDTSGRFMGDLSYGYVDGLKRPTGAGGLILSADDQIRIQSWGTVTCTVRIVGNILTNIFQNSSWTGVFESPMTGQGVLKSIVGTNPSAGQNVSEEVPSGSEWEIDSLKFGFTTDATVSTRRVRVQPTDGSSSFYLILASNTQTASSTLSYVGVSGEGIDPSVANNNDQILPMPEDLRLKEGWKIESSVSNLQAGDDIATPLLKVRERLKCVG